LPIGNGERVLLDSSFFIALQNNNDNLHEAAIERDDELTEVTAQRHTVDWVLDEAVTVALKRTGRKDICVELASIIRDEGMVHMHWTDTRRVDDALAIFRKYSDKEFSLTDCVLLAVAEQKGIRYLLTADNEFRTIPDGPEVIDLSP
jgi:uncharacterized protein